MSYISGPIDQNNFRLTKKNVINLRHAVIISRIQILKFSSPRFARRKGHNRIFKGEMAAENGHFFIEPFQKSTGY